MKVLSIVGARPQFVKAHAVSEQRRRRDHEAGLVHTGQHSDQELSDVFFEQLGLPEPEYNLGVGSGSHSRQTGEMILELGDVVERERPDVVLVFGDTNSTLAGAVVASKASPTLAHVEAGLRSFDSEMPEEINRVATDHCSDVLLAPSERAMRNLEDESLGDAAYYTGDVMYDTLLQVRERVSTTIPFDGDLPEEFVLATVHRAGNTSDRDRLAEIVDGLRETSDPVVFPAHPRTVEALDEFGLRDRVGDGVEIVDPVGYLEFLELVDRARCVATDSGGVQKEAFYLDTPCVTMRDRTEWTETTDSGWNVLVGADADRIVEAVESADDLPPKPDLYGGGNAAERVVSILEDEVR